VKVLKTPNFTYFGDLPHRLILFSAKTDRIFGKHRVKIRSFFSLSARIAFVSPAHPPPFHPTNRKNGARARLPNLRVERIVSKAHTFTLQLHWPDPSHLVSTDPVGSHWQVEPSCLMQAEPGTWGLPAYPGAHLPNRGVGRVLK